MHSYLSDFETTFVLMDSKDDSRYLIFRKKNGKWYGG